MRMVLGTAILAAGLAGAPHGSDLRAAAAVTSRAAAPEPTAEQAALHARIVDEYMKGNWGPLAGDLIKGTHELTALPKDMGADILTIKEAVGECRQPWWNQVKTGRALSFTAKVWDRNLPIVYDVSLPEGQVRIGYSGGRRTIAVHWSTEDMDSAAAGEHGFTKGEQANITVWTALELVELYLRMDQGTMMSMSAARKRQFFDFLSYRGMLAAAYYGTPRAREWAFFLACDAYQNGHLADAGFIPKRPLAVVLVAEIASHPERYPSLRLPANLPPENLEQRLAAGLMSRFEKPLTFAEDKALRDAVRVFATTPGNMIPAFASGRVMLANKLEMMLDPAKDGEAAGKRDAWLRAQLNRTVPTTQP